jgi:hypothetical protein
VNSGDLTVKLIGFDKDGLFFRQFVVSVNSVAFENAVVTVDVEAEESLPVSECVGIQILFGQDSDVRAKKQRICRQRISLVAKFQHNRLEHCWTGIGPLVRMIGRGQISHHSPDDGVILLKMKRGPRQDTVVFFRDEIPKDVRVKRFESDKVEIHVHSSAFERTEDADVVGEMLRFVRTLSPCSAQVPTFKRLFKRRQTLFTYKDKKLLTALTYEKYFTVPAK